MYMKSVVFPLQAGNDPYAFVEFKDSSAASAALAAMNKKVCMGKVGHSKRHRVYLLL